MICVLLAHKASANKARMEVMGTTRILTRCLGGLVLAVLLLAMQGFALAAGPVETSIFAVQGVAVDVTDTDADTAKNKALIEVQMKAFLTLAERLGNPALVEAVSKYEEKQVLPYLRSLSIEEESISPGRYKGKLTVRFLPAKIRALYADFGVRVASEQGPSFLVLPVWTTAGGQVLWEDNPWRQAWINLRAEQSLIPVIVPLGDFDDTEMISVADVINKDVVKLEALRRRYDVKAVIIAFAEAAEGGGVHARMLGDSPLGKLTFDKIYTADSGTLPESADLAALRFHKVMVDKYKSGAADVAAKDAGSGRQSMRVAVPFSGPSEWSVLRSRILSTPGVLGLDVATLSGEGAVVSLAYAGTLEDMQSSLQATGLSLIRAGGAWAIIPL